MLPRGILGAIKKVEILMTEPNTIPRYDKQHFAVVDLGSNSFHLLITHLNSENILSIRNKVTQKVRLASGLTCENQLTEEAINRGLACLKIFSEHLTTIPKENILIVATAALRIARNNNVFLEQANTILPKNIQLLSGEQEANTIYAGVSFTDNSPENNGNNKTKRLVIDIGGASTEIIVGEKSTPKKLVSLDIGCVSFINKYFTDGLLNETNFEQCIHAASNEIKKVSHSFISLGWQSALSRSGTMQAMAEILVHQGKPANITLEFLHQIKQTLIECGTIEHIKIDGLRPDRAAVLASGLSILISLFNELAINSIQLSTGALREGLLSQLLPNARLVN